MQSSSYWSSEQRSSSAEQKCHFARLLAVTQHICCRTFLNLFSLVLVSAFFSLSDAPAVSIKSCVSYDSSDLQHKAGRCSVISGKVFTSGYFLTQFLSGHLALGESSKWRMRSNILIHSSSQKSSSRAVSCWNYLWVLLYTSFKYQKGFLKSTLTFSMSTITKKCFYFNVYKPKKFSNIMISREVQVTFLGNIRMGKRNWKMVNKKIHISPSD